MSLEEQQGIQNGIISAVGNISASNDPKQIPNDANETLIKGAELAAAGRTLQMSEEETLAQVSKAYRRQKQRDAYRNQSQRKQDMAEWEQKKASLGNWEASAELQGVSVQGDDYTEEEMAFGQEQTQYFDDYRPDDKLYNESRANRARDRRDDLLATAESRRERLRKGMTEAEKADLAEYRQIISENSNGGRPDVAPTSALRGLLRELRSGGEKYGYSRFNQPGINAADVASRLEDHIEPTTGPDKAMARETVRRDNERFNRDVVLANDREAKGDAALIRFLRTEKDLRAQANLESVGYITDIGGSGMKASEGAAAKGYYDDAHVIDTAKTALKGEILQRTLSPGDIAIDTAGNVVDLSQYVDPQWLATDGKPNSTSTADQLNAPSLARQWIADNIPEYRESDRTFGGFPQVDITLETTNFANKARELGKKLEHGGLQQLSANLRTPEELDAAVKQIIKAKRGDGGVFYQRDPETRKNVAVDNPGVDEVLQLMRFSGPEKERLANAMFQMDAARRSSVNQNQKQTYDMRATQQGPLQLGTGEVIYDAASAIDGSSASVAQQIRGSKVDGKDIVAEMAKLPSEGAQKPFIGAVAGERKKPAYKKPGNMGSGEELEKSIRRQAISRVKPGGKLDRERTQDNIAIARGIEDQESASNAERARKMDSIIRSLPPAARAQGIDKGPARDEVSPVDLPAGLVNPMRAEIKGEQSFTTPGTGNGGGLRRPRQTEFRNYGSSVMGEGGSGEGGGVIRRGQGGALVSLRQPQSASSGPASRPYDSNTDYDVASSFEGFKPSPKAEPEAPKQQSSADEAIARYASERKRPQRPQRPSLTDMQRRIGTGAAIAGGLTLAGKGLYDITRPEEEERRYA